MPNRADVLLLMGAICYQLKDYQQCISYNDRCILIDPNLAEAHANLANALQQLGNIDMAIVYYQVSSHQPKIQARSLYDVAHRSRRWSCVQQFAFDCNG